MGSGSRLLLDSHALIWWLCLAAALRAQHLGSIITGQGFTELAITVQHAKLAGDMKFDNNGEPIDIAALEVERR